MARFCGKCGTTMFDYESCPRCGWVDANYRIQKQNMEYAEPRKMSTAGKAIWVAIILIVVGVAGFFVVNNAHVAQISFHVHSIHITEDIDVMIYVDGDYVTTWNDIPPGDTFYSRYYYQYKFSYFDSAKLIEVKAVSTGGGLGLVTDVESLIVQDGGKYRVDLYV